MNYLRRLKSLLGAVAVAIMLNIFLSLVMLFFYCVVGAGIFVFFSPEAADSFMSISDPNSPIFRFYFKMIATIFFIGGVLTIIGFLSTVLCAFLKDDDESDFPRPHDYCGW